MTFKQIGIAALMMSASSMTLADIRVIDSQAGSWVRVTEQGHPAANARVSVNNKSNRGRVFTTNERGEVFIPLYTRHSQVLEYSVLTENGNEYSETALHTKSSDN